MKNKYSYRVEWSEEDNSFVARCLEFPSLATHGATSEKALHILVELVDDVLKDMKKSDEKIPEPLGTRKYKGQIPLRVSPDVHKRLVVAAAEQEVSLNQFLLTKVISGL